MSFTVNPGRLWKQGRGSLFFICLAVGLLLAFALGSTAWAEEGQTTLTVSLKGLSTDDGNAWRSLSISGRFEVSTPEGQTLGLIRANPTQEQREQGESDMLVFPAPAPQKLRLTPVMEDFQEGFVCQGTMDVSLTAGESNHFTAVAYAAQGLFSVENILQGSGKPAAQAEYMVLDAQGNMQLSFATDEQGRYFSQRALPNGEYQLVQLRSSQGTLPNQQPQAFSVSTYFGDPTQVTQVLVVSRPVPDVQGQVELQVVKSQPFSQEQDSDTDTYFSTIILSPVMKRSSDLPLYNLAVMLIPTALRDEQGQRMEVQGALMVESISVSGLTQGYGAWVQGLDAAGQPIGKGQVATPGNLAVMDNGSVGALVTYMNLATGEAMVPSDFEPGQVRAAALYHPFVAAAGGWNASEAMLSSSLRYEYRYSSPDGSSLISAAGRGEDQEMVLPILDGRAVLSLRASHRQDAQGAHELVLALDQAAGDLPEGIMLAACLTAGARADEQRMNENLMLLRTREQDIVAFSLEQLGAGVISVPLKAGQLDSVEIRAYDPSNLAKTAVNPGGARIVAETHTSDALLDALFSKRQGLYAVLPCEFSESISLTEAMPFTKILVEGTLYEDLDRTGTQSREDAILAGHGVLLKGEQTRVYYGAITGEDGRFAIYAQEDSPDRSGTLMAILPQGAISPEADSLGVLKHLAASLPLEGYAIGYERRGLIQGKVLLDHRTPLAGVLLTLQGDGQILGTAITDAAGEYAFSGLPAGEYQVTLELPQELHVAWVSQEGLMVERTKAAYGVALVYGQQVVINAGAVSLGRVTGLITQQNQGLAGFAVQLVSPGGEILTQDTDSHGAFVFESIPQGTYTLRLELPAGVAVVEVNGEGIKVLSLYEEALALGSGEESAWSIELGRTATLKGQVPLVSQGQSVIAASLTDQVSGVTDAQGRFVLEGLVAGDYTLYAPLAQGKTLADNQVWKVSQQGDMAWMPLTVVAGEDRELPGITLMDLTSIEGVAYVDANGDHLYTLGEQLLSGVGVVLQKKEGEGWSEVASCQTDESGAYAFRNLQEGLYRVASMARTETLCIVAVGNAANPLGSGGVMVSQELALTQGESLKHESDIALGEPASLHFAAFADSNENGTRGEYERPIAGVMVEVVDAQGKALASGTTDGAGEAFITGVIPGEAALRITLPHGYRFTVKGTGQGLGVSCAASEDAIAQSDFISFVAGQVTQAAVAAVPVGSFSGRVWLDENNNGIMDPQEPGVGGVPLSLEGSKSGKTFTVVSGENGEYLFQQLPNDRYTLIVQLPEGLLFARYSETGGDLRSVITVAGNKGSREFPVAGAADVVNKNVGVIPKGTIKGAAFLDLNYNGLRDEGEPGYPGVILEVYRTVKTEPLGRLITGEDGSFAFESLRAGEYRLRAILPDDGSVFTIVSSENSTQANRFAQQKGRREASVAPITIGTGGTAVTVVGVAQGATIKGTVFADDNYNGILQDKEKKHSGVRVELRDEGGALVSAALTNANGNYTLEGIMPGRYILAFQRKDKHAFSRFRPGEKGGNWVRSLQGEFGLTEPLDIAMGQSITGINAGMLPSSTLTGIFFDDLNDNGLRDEGEMGMEDVRVRLYSQDAEIDLTVPVQADGSYFFDGVMPGKYTLTYLLPEYVEPARNVQEGNTLKGSGREVTSEEFSIKSGTQITRPLAGGVRLGTFTGYLFHDVNANGVQDEGEERATGLTITLTPDRADLEVARVEADQEGNFAVSQLRPANYQLGLKLEDPYIFSSDIKATNIRLDTASEQKMNCPWAALISREQNAIGRVAPATLRGHVWLDEDLSGKQSHEEALLPGLTFELVDENLGRTIKQAVSKEDGYVTFASVRPGRYTVRFAIPAQSEPAGEGDASMKAQGGMMVQSGIQVEEGQTFENIHAGLACRSSIGGVVALEEGGQRSGISGIQVTLYQEGSDKPVGTATTGEDGSYRFDGLWPGSYSLTCGWPQGMIFIEPSDPNYVEGTSVIVEMDHGQGISAAFALKMARSLLAQNVLLIRPAKLGDLAWLDLNKNGLLDAGEPGIPGITVQLLSQGKVATETTTNAYGYYLFENIYPGEYVLQAKAYPQLSITIPVPQLRIISSCLTGGDGEEARSDPFALVSGSVNLDFDLGYVLEEGQTLPAVFATPPPKDWTGSYVSGGGK
ncbi:MAG: hypothetical protein GXY67_02200 [Clostridiales bacterium]|nr:hypothetical protein [Clostridiales bacterium]